MQNMSATESEISRRNVGSDNIVKLSSRWLAHLNLSRSMDLASSEYDIPSPFLYHASNTLLNSKTLLTFTF